MRREEYMVHGGLPLAPESLLCIDDGREMLVSVREGCAWITQEGDRRDVTLKAGDRFRIGRGGRTLVYALRACRVALASPYEQACARRIDLFDPAGSQPVPGYRAGRGWLALRTRFMKAWVGLYAAARSSLIFGVSVNKCGGSGMGGVRAAADNDAFGTA